MREFLIWSNQKQLWWRANRLGYTGVVDEAGRYARGEAERIVARATVDGQLTVRRTDPYTGDEYSCVDEVMLLAPESIAEVAAEIERLTAARDRYVADVAHLRQQLRDANTEIAYIEGARS